MLVNASIHQETPMTLFYNRVCINVEGDAVSTRRTP
jgi:hypothetical protein